MAQQKKDKKEKLFAVSPQIHVIINEGAMKIWNFLPLQSIHFELFWMVFSCALAQCLCTLNIFLLKALGTLTVHNERISYYFLFYNRLKFRCSSKHDVIMHYTYYRDDDDDELIHFYYGVCFNEHVFPVARLSIWLLLCFQLKTWHSLN